MSLQETTAVPRRDLPEEMVALQLIWASLTRMVDGIEGNPYALEDAALAELIRLGVIVRSRQQVQSRPLFLDRQAMRWLTRNMTETDTKLCWAFAHGCVARDR